MTVQTTSSKAGPFLGNGATRVWTTAFKVDQSKDLQVYYTDPTGAETLLDASLYAVSGFGDPNGIGVTYPLSGAPLGTAEKITLLRVVNYDQQTNLTNQGGFYPAVIEKALDRIVYQCQQLAEKVGRAVLVGVSSNEDASAAFNAIAVNAALAQNGAVTATAAAANAAGSAAAAAAAAASVSLPIPVASGGTGAIDVATARGNLGLGSAATKTAGTAANNVVQLDATGKLPAIDGSALIGTIGGRLLNIVTFTSSGTYSKNPASSYVFVYVLGAGGGAGNSLGAASQQPRGQGGAGGGCAIRKLMSLALSATETITVGAGGLGAAASSISTKGNDGGSSSFGSWCSASGGIGGAGMNGPLPSYSTACLGGIGVGGDINLRGKSPSHNQQLYSSTGPDARSSPGGDGAGPYGGPGAPAILSTTSALAGNNADVNSGGGGAGGYNTYNTNGAQQAGGNGGSGLVIIFEYA